MLSYHYVREALATGEYVYSFVNGKYNPSDVLSKHWCHNDVYPILRPILFMSGNVFDSPYSTWFHDNTKTQTDKDRGVTNKYALCLECPISNGIPTNHDIFLLKVDQEIAMSDFPIHIPIAFHAPPASC